ncbi:auxin-responsive protein SAUR78-like [Diospyros lotus]|uniref:auxin-responsive protein SAUR78-like n=1 Tax=Diospyros lotus TaxID=55363 RepID=UPI00225B4011|nr:auxin-responsive protein SAUR78-like [Diospyros lotus]
MAKGGKLTKLKSVVLKKWNSFSKLGRATAGGSVAAASHSSSSDYDDSSSSSSSSSGSYSYNNNSSSKMISSGAGLHTVYVGKSRRRYLLSSEVVDNPVFRELVERSGDNGDSSVTVVGCEVVLFEHLLWMLENADPQPESLDDLVQYYTL